MSAETEVLPPITAAVSTSSTHLAVCRPANEQLSIVIRDREYDVSKWKYTHPGGHHILEKYRNKDATDVFDALHGEESHHRLAKMPSKPVSTPFPVDSRQKNFRALRARIIKEGLLDRQPLWYLYKTVTTLAIFAAGIYLGLAGHWLWSAVLLGLYWQQAGWLSHEYAHHCVFTNRTLNSVVGYLIGNLTMGFSLEWWRQRHNTHHAITNVLESDPDVDNLPIFCWSVDDAHRIRSLGRYIIPYQHVYFLPFTSLLRIIWCLSSMIFVRLMPASPSKAIRGKFWAEFFLMSLFYTWYVTFMLKICPTWTIMAYHFAISQGIAGAALGWVVFMNHYACDLYTPGMREQLSFVELQLYTTRNIQPGILMDWFAGGLNYQIEHHLFPTMPRCNLNRASKIVREFCTQNGIPYQSESMWGCMKYVHERLYSVAQVSRMLSLKQA